MGPRCEGLHLPPVSSKPEACRELQLTSCLRGGGLTEQRRAQLPNIVGVVGLIQDIESGEAAAEHFLVVAARFCQVEVVAPEKIEVFRASRLQCRAANAGRTSITEAGVKVIAASGLGVRTAGVESGADAECKPMVGIDVADKVEGVQSVFVGASPLVVWMVLVLWKPVESLGIAHGPRE